jgi:hypothetical protein
VDGVAEDGDQQVSRAARDGRREGGAAGADPGRDGPLPLLDLLEGEVADLAAFELGQDVGFDQVLVLGDCGGLDVEELAPDVDPFFQQHFRAGPVLPGAVHLLGDLLRRIRVGIVGVLVVGRAVPVVLESPAVPGQAALFFCPRLGAASLPSHGVASLPATGQQVPGVALAASPGGLPVAGWWLRPGLGVLLAAGGPPGLRRSRGGLRR